MGVSGSTERQRGADLRDWAIIVGGLIVYAAVFRLAYPYVGPSAFLFSLLPLLLTTSCFGTLGGVLAAGLHIPLSFALLAWAAPTVPLMPQNTTFWVNHLVLAFIGAWGGYFFDQRRALKEQLRRAAASEQAVRDEEQRYRTVFDSAADSIVIHDMDGRFLEANQVACEWFGLSREALLGKRRADVIPAQVIATDTLRMARLRNGESVVFESVHRSPDGTEIPVEVNSRVVRYRGQTAILSIARDITERRKAAEALRASQQMLQLILDHIPVAVFWKDRDSIYLGCNREFAADSGLASVEQVIGRTDYEMPWVEQADLYRADDRSVIARGVPKLRYEEVQTTPSGTKIWLRTSKVPLQGADGQVAAILGMYEDITEDRIAEERLRSREQFLALLNDITRVALESTDLHTMLQMLADRLVSLFEAEGCSLALIGVPSIKGVSATPPELVMAHSGPALREGAVAQQHLSWVEATIRSGKPMVIEDPNETPPLGRRASSLYPGHAFLILPLIAGQQKLGAVLLAFLPPHSFSREELARAEQVADQMALAAAKAYLVEAMRAYIAELESRNEELDAFGHTVAHDLKEPLGLVLGYAGLLNTKGEPLEPDQMRAALGTLQRQGERMERIIDELLLLSGLRSAEVSVVPLDMGGVIHEALQRYSHAIESQKAIVTMPEAWPVALGYGPWIEEVWANYISNALKYGGHPPLLEAGAEPSPDGMVRFWLRDNGSGLTPETQERLFTSFPRLHQLRVQGHGLGLSIVRRIIEKLGGKVGAEALPEGGSRFWFELPAG